MENQTKRQIELRQEIIKRLQEIREEYPLKSIEEILDELPDSNDKQGAMDRLILVHALTEETERLYQENRDTANDEKNSFNKAL